MSKKRNKKIRPKTVKSRVTQAHSLPSPFNFLNHPKRFQFFFFILGFLLYANTLTHDYTQDDAIVIYDNMYTTQGIKGIPGLLTKDTFFGFFKVEGKSKLVSGGRYRPLTPVMFALEWQIFGRAPWIGHLINIILYGLLCMLIYRFILTISLKNAGFSPYLFAAICALIYTVHPIHTEVVANIKGRDEIISMLGSVLGLLLCVKACQNKNLKWAILGGICFFLGLMSKENAIMFLLLAPLTFYFFVSKQKSVIIKYLSPMAVGALVFLLIRSSILGFDFGGESSELMNNPFLKLVGNQYVPFSGSEKMATIFFTLGKYIQLLVFPHPLTHDYYPRHIDIMHFTDYRVLLSLVAYLGMAFIAIMTINKNKWISYGILFYLISLSIVSNILFPIGTNMSERFLFMPSLGFAIIVGYFISKWFTDSKFTKIILIIFVILISLLGTKTITRNTVWKDDLTLFTTDVNTSKRSAKLLNAAGGALTANAVKPEFENEKETMLRRAIGYLDRAVEIHPRYKNPFLIKGNCHYYLEEYEQAIENYNQALSIDPAFEDARKNLGISYREAGRRSGSVNDNLSQALDYLTRAYNLNRSDYETVRLLGIAYGRSGNHQVAVRYFKEAVSLRPDIASGYSNLGNAYSYLGQEEEAQKQFEIARQLESNKENE